MKHIDFQGTGSYTMAIIKWIEEESPYKSAQEKSRIPGIIPDIVPSKEKQRMEWSERMNAAIEYIEDNLAGEISFAEVAKRSCCSSFYFQRMFFAIIGVTPAEYTRRRRLTLAAKDLTSTNSKVIDVALKYGYDSPDSFSRTFRNFQGINPLAARKAGVKLTAFPRISFNVILKGGNDMDYKIIEKPGFDVIGKTRKFPEANVDNFIRIPQFWDEFKKDENENKVLTKLNQDTPGQVTGAAILGINICEAGADEFTYVIGVETVMKKVPAGFETIHIPAETWAVFESIGPMPKALQDVYKRIYSEWFPSTGYEHGPEHEIEVYLPGDQFGKDYHCQMWIPIVKQKIK
jgi:AraC family transcriptional regulator